eukprot:3813439-Rhodomonas_salina.2
MLLGLVGWVSAGHVVGHVASTLKRCKPSWAGPRAPHARPPELACPSLRTPEPCGAPAPPPAQLPAGRALPSAECSLSCQSSLTPAPPQERAPSYWPASAPLHSALFLAASASSAAAASVVACRVCCRWQQHLQPHCHRPPPTSVAADKSTSLPSASSSPSTLCPSELCSHPAPCSTPKCVSVASHLRCGTSFSVYPSLAAICAGVSLSSACRRRASSLSNAHRIPKQGQCRTSQGNNLSQYWPLHSACVGTLPRLQTAHPSPPLPLLPPRCYHRMLSEYRASPRSGVDR